MHARMDWDAPAPVKQRGLNLIANEAARRDPFHRRSCVNALTPTTLFAAVKAATMSRGRPDTT